jgi:hypothetical protein
MAIKCFKTSAAWLARSPETGYDRNNNGPALTQGRFD